jgi:branched-chain amino acid transport system ATP-binding protein
MVAIGRGLMACPRFLVMDEPSLGLAPIYVNNLFGTIQSIRATGTPILLVEQNVHRALELADRGYVMQTGSIVISGPSTELLRRPDLAAAYLGTE